MKIIKITTFVKNAEVIRVYHGTKVPLNTFDKNKESSYWPGFYVTKELEMAKKFGPIIYQFDLSGTYYPISNFNDSKLLKDKARKAGYPVPDVRSGYVEAEYLKSIGYSGIIVRGGHEYVVFEPNDSLSNKIEISATNENN